MLKFLLLLTATVMVAGHRNRISTTVPLRAIVKLGSKCLNPGNVTFTQFSDGSVHVTSILQNLYQGTYIMHIHENDDRTMGCLPKVYYELAGTNKTSCPHKHRHITELGKFFFKGRPTSYLKYEMDDISLIGADSIVGRALVLYEKRETGLYSIACGFINKI